MCIDASTSARTLQDVVGAGDQKQMVGQLVTRVGNLEAALWEAEKSRRRNHNELMEVKGNIRVFCRLRPCSGAVAVDPLHGDGVRCLVDAKPHDFFFDRCGTAPLGGKSLLHCHLQALLLVVRLLLAVLLPGTIRIKGSCHSIFHTSRFV